MITLIEHFYMLFFFFTTVLNCQGNTCYATRVLATQSFYFGTKFVYIEGGRREDYNLDRIDFRHAEFKKNNS